MGQVESPAKKPLSLRISQVKDRGRTGFLTRASFFYAGAPHLPMITHPTQSQVGCTWRRHNVNIPADLKYTKKDEWIRVEGKIGIIGITDYAQDQLSDVVYADVTVSVGKDVAKGSAFGSVESVKAASEVYLPASGKVTEVNSLLEETPEVINTDPYGDAWMVKIELSNPADLADLMDAAAYGEYLKHREH